MERLHKKSKKMKQLKKQLKHQQDEFEAQQQVSNYKNFHSFLITLTRK